ncbi:MAG: alpha/beta hydrolase family protein [Lachnospiraceae bacterium]
MYTTNTFLSSLINEAKSKQDLLNCLEDEINKVQESMKDRLIHTLRLNELKQKWEKSLDYEEVDRERYEDFERIKYTIKGIEKLPFPLYVLKPDKGNGKTILYLHGHDDMGIMGALIKRNDKERYHFMLPLTLAKLGYTVVAPECMGFGESYYEFVKGEPAKSGCFMNTTILSMCGFNIIGVRVLQVIKSMDFVQAEKLPEDMTLFGVSGGALTGTMVSVLDTRIKRIALAAYPNSYEDSILRKEHCIENYIPGIYQVGNSYQILSLVAPRPLLVLNGKYDRGFPIEGTEKAIAHLKQVYVRLHAQKNFAGILFDGKHEISVPHVISWLEEFI